jgi:DNA-binding transcriptional LysR family regulator
MMTFKQLEAVYWIATLGSFSAAAQRLHTTQSALSKRVQELEAVFDIELFDRSLRAARLTEKGEEMFFLAKRLLEHRDEAVEQFSRPDVIERRVRIGVTEVTAMTWLHNLVAAIEQRYPKVVIEPDVDASLNLRDKVLADELDLIFVPDAFTESFTEPPLRSIPIGEFSTAWMCKPGLLPDGKTFRLQELASHRLLVQGRKSSVGVVQDNWMRSLGVQPSNTIALNNLVALIGLAVSGLGIGCFPTQCLRPLIEQGALMIVPCDPQPPTIKYIAMVRGENRSKLVSSLAALAQECCHFGEMFNLLR